MENVDMKKEALSLVKHGFSVFPVAPKNTMPLGDWFKIATSDIEQIEQWWNKNSKYNIGIKTGIDSGVVVLRFKTNEAFIEAEKRGLPLTPTVRRDKGIDVYFKYQEDLNELLVSERFSDISLFSDGSHILAPPSVVQLQPPSSFYKPDVYSWCEGKGFTELPLAEMPSWLLKTDRDLAEPVPQDDEVEVMQQDQLEIEPVMVSMGQREDHLQASDLDQVVVSGTNEQEKNNSSHDNKSEPVTCNEWKAPKLFDKFQVEEIKSDVLPSWLGDYAKAISDSRQTPEGLAVMLGLSMIATCVQKKFVVAPRDGRDYTEQLALWTVTVLNSGERKSPILSDLRAPLVTWQKEQAALLKDRILETSTAISVAQKRIETLHKEAANKRDADERQNIIDQITEIKRSMPVEVKAPVLWTSDVTPEELQDMLAEHGERMALLSAEGNIFEVMGGLYSDKVNIDIFLQAYSGESTRINRRSRKAELDNPALTFGMAVQPVVIESFAKGPKSQFKGKGALARFLYCIPEPMVGQRDTDLDIRVSEEVKVRYEDGIKGLLSIPMMVDGSGQEVPRMLTLDVEAFKVYKDFDRGNEKSMAVGGELEQMNDWGGKLPGNALRIAGLMHLVEHGADSTVIEKDTMAKAVHLCELLIEHAKAAFGMAGAYEPNADAKKVFEWMKEREYKTFTKTDCYDRFKTFGKERLEKALQDLENRNILKELIVPTSGKSATNYISNPLLK